MLKHRVGGPKRQSVRRLRYRVHFAGAGFPCTLTATLTIDCSSFTIARLFLSPAGVHLDRHAKRLISRFRRFAAPMWHRDCLTASLRATCRCLDNRRLSQSRTLDSVSRSSTPFSVARKLQWPETGTVLLTDGPQKGSMNQEASFVAPAAGAHTRLQIFTQPQATAPARSSPPTHRRRDIYRCQQGRRCCSGSSTIREQGSPLSWVSSLTRNYQPC